MVQLEDLKQEIAEERGYDNWDDVLKSEAWDVVDSLIFRYAILYNQHQEGQLYG